MSSGMGGGMRKTAAGCLQALAAALTLAALPVGTVLADPAATAESAWSALPRATVPRASNPAETRGKEVFDQRCATCHGAVPAETFGPPFLPPMPGTQALQARYRGTLPAELEQRTDLVDAYVRTVVRNGYVSMPFFRPTELSADDLDALAAYLTRGRSTR